MQKSVRDIGSLFYKLQPGDSELNNLPDEGSFLISGSYAFFYTGRHAIFAVLNAIKEERTVNKIWMPRYFCHNVINAVKSNFEHVHFYDVKPFDFEEEINVETFASENDVVLLNNYWGLNSYTVDTAKEKRPIIIEDHSHGWRTENCKNSKADYAICSIRKTYPIPLGAIAWKPNGDLFETAYENNSENPITEAYSKLKRAQEIKRQYIETGSLHLQKQFLKLLNEGEELVSSSKYVHKPSIKHLSQIRYYLIKDPNKIKNENLNSVLRLLENSIHFKIIKRNGFTPFGLLLLFKDEPKFLDFKSFMIENKIYAANLWPENSLENEWQYFFNIHIDFRYSLDDMQYLATKINYWSQQNA